MATIKVFDVNGVKELKCFDTLDNLDYLEPVDKPVCDLQSELSAIDQSNYVRQLRGLGYGPDGMPLKE